MVYVKFRCNDKNNVNGHGFAFADYAKLPYKLPELMVTNEQDKV